MATKKSTKNIKKKKSTRAAKAHTRAKTSSSPRKVKPAGSSVKPAKKKPVSAAKKVAKRPSSAVRKTVAKKVSKKLPAAMVKTGEKKKQKTRMTPRERIIQQIRMNLLRQKDTLLSEAEAALNELPGQTIFPDLGDQATAETDRNFMLRLRGREQRLLKKIDEAISRIDNGTFGICDDCGNEIEMKRLEARPVTTMCIECKTLQEEEEKLREV
jgi:DnaK suppressor protein